ncbi:MAG: hypothetical protein ACRBCL_16075 [Maritimibacter sp.]
MRVTNIDIRDLDWDARDACYRGSVSMLMIPQGTEKPMRVNYICRSFREQDCPSSLITYDLVSHALTQARQMPGFRRGERNIEVDISTAVTPASSQYGAGAA